MKSHENIVILVGFHPVIGLSYLETKKIHDFWFLSGCDYPLSSLSSSFVGDSSPWLQTVVRCSSIRNVPKLVLFSRGKFDRILQDPPLIDVPDIEKLALKSHVLNSTVTFLPHSKFCEIRSPLALFLNCFGYSCNVDMTPLYDTLTASSILDLDQNLLASMRASNDEELKKLHGKIMDDAEENLGESEIREAHLAKAVAVGQKMDLKEVTGKGRTV
ncbi:unnamed protein product [Arabis nemorensis]|uniref:Uncharacterized protein n=1 Tax=Arabis nemorensis TaxID=586526 RepID=A0A565ARZ9_9BRAS|nr:unnamed protein product [Arabis nemorensis]